MLSFQKDNFINDFIEQFSHWEVTLNNGYIVYQDDGRPGFYPRSGWIRLKQYCEENNLYIVKMKFGFRCNTKSLPENMDGYYFAKSAMGCFGSSKTTHYFIVGYVQDGKIYVQEWKVPEMLKQSEEQRELEEGPCLIRKNTNQNLAQKI